MKLHAKMDLPNITNKLHFAPLYYKTGQRLLQNARVILYYKIRQGFYYKIGQFYYKRWQLLQSLTVLLQNVAVIAKYNVHYKMRQYKSIANLNKEFFHS